MGGQLAVESTLGDGSTFHFSLQLPVATVQPAMASTGATPVRVLDRAPVPDKLLSHYLQQWQLTAEFLRTPTQLLAKLNTDHGALPPPLIIKASWLPLTTPEQWARIRELTLVPGRILLVDAPVEASVSAEFGHQLRWPGSVSALFDALAVSTSLVLSSLDPDNSALAASPLVQPHRLLLVDDNPINRKLAVRLLEGFGHSVEQATNGQEAMDRVIAEPFDLVLMDVQMPVMDGFQATFHIRQREAREGLARTPIVAMTAHAMAEDRQRCLAAGMDGHLSKPIVKLALQAAVAQHARTVSAHPLALPRPHSAITATATASASPGTSAESTGPIGTTATAGIDRTPVVDSAEPPTVLAPPRPQAIRDQATALAHLDGDADLLRELTEMFLDGVDAQMAELLAIAPPRDLPRLSSLAHALKGSVSALGAIEAREKASALEIAARQGDAVQSADLQQGLHTALQRLKADLASQAGQDAFAI